MNGLLVLTLVGLVTLVRSNGNVINGKPRTLPHLKTNNEDGKPAKKAEKNSSISRAEFSCPAEFQGKCRCGVGEYEELGMRYITNCTNAGFQSISMLPFLPPDTEVLIFTGNHIETLEHNAFGENPFEKLEVIDLSNNNISHIRGGAFHRVPGVTKLILNNNRWSIGDTVRLFANMEHLRELHLYHALNVNLNDSVLTLMNFFRKNPLSELKVLNLSRNGIGPALNLHVFCAIPTLENISLSHNRLVSLRWTELPKDWEDDRDFPISDNHCPLPKLRILDISNNLLPYLLNDTIHYFEQLDSFRLHMENNPFDCDCNLLDFYQWIHIADTHVVSAKELLCEDGYPEDNYHRFIYALDPSDLQCQVPTPLMYGIGIAHILIVTLLVVMTSLLLGIVYVHRHSVFHTCRRVTEPVYRRMQYSSLRKPDEREMKEMEV